MLMPGMDGFQVIRHITGQEILKELPIFVLTAKTLTPQEVSLLGHNTQALFQKSGQEQLVSEINRVVQRKRAKSAGQT
jgi:CheY-like chemotaxis protein